MLSTRSAQNQANAPRRRRGRSWRPRLELLEDRCLLSAGDLDPTFGAGGIVVTDLGSTSDTTSDLALQADGKVVVLGSVASNQRGVFGLVRYLPSGALDPTFGSGGIGNGDGIKTGGGGKALALGPDGKIAVLGSYLASNKANDTGILVARFNPNGSLDKTFNRSGYVAINPSPSQDDAWAIAVQPDGKVLAAGAVFKDTTTAAKDFWLARYNVDGSLDSSFGSGGIVSTDFSEFETHPNQSISSDSARSVQLLPDGKILVAGSMDIGFALARYNPNGSLDATFGTGGKLSVPTQYSVDGGKIRLALFQGKMILGASYNQPGDGQVILGRLNADGSLDSTFGGTGLVTFGLGQDPAQQIRNSEYFAGLTVQPNGAVAVAGYRVVTQSPTGQISSTLFLARYTEQGTLDPAFGSGGVVTTSVNNNRSGEVAKGLVLQPDGKFLVSGTTTRTTAAGTGDQDYLLVRYQGDSALQALGSPAAAGAQALTEEQVQPLLAEAIRRWSAAGVDTSGLNVSVRIADLAGSYLGLTDGKTIWLDVNAAGFGWFVDSTPWEDSEFTTPGDQGEQGHMDLLTALVHELGHVLGHDHPEEGVMAEALATGTRVANPV